MQPISQARLARTPRCYSAAAFIVDPREARVLYAKSRLHYIETRQKRGFLHDGIYYSSQLSKMLQDNNPHETEARRKFFFAKVPKVQTSVLKVDVLFCDVMEGILYTASFTA